MRVRMVRIYSDRREKRRLNSIITTRGKDCPKSYDFLDSPFLRKWRKVSNSYLKRTDKIERVLYMPMERTFFVILRHTNAMKLLKLT